MRRILIVVGLVVITFFSISGIALSAEADQEIGLALRPAIMELAAEPGVTVSTTIFIQNISGSAVSVEVGAQSLIPNDPEIDQLKRKDSDASTWLIDKGRKFLLGAGEQRSVDVQFLVPENAEPGGNYAMVTFTTSSAQLLAAPGSVVTPSLTSLALINVAGDIVEEASIEQLDTSFLLFGSEQTLSFNIANTGNVHILPTSTVKIYDRSDNLVESISIPPQLILPNTTKKYDIKWSTDGRVGIHRVEVDLSYGSPEQFATLDTGTIIFLPSYGGLLFILSILAATVFVGFFILKKPLRRLYWHFKGVRVGPKLMRRGRGESENKPEALARLSMNSTKIDELLSRNKRRAEHSPPKKAKQRKIIIR